MIMSKITWEAAVGQLRADAGRQELVRHCYYDDPLRAAAERFAGSAEWGAVRGIVGSARGVFLDVGAGRGIASYAAARDGWEVVALEPDPSGVGGAEAIRGLAMESGLRIRVVEDAGEAIPLADESVAVVYGRAVFHHVGDHAGFCREAARVLAPGGIFVMTREHVIDCAEELPVFLREHPLHELYGGESAYLIEEYERAITGSGMVMRQRLGPSATPVNFFPRTEVERKGVLRGEVRERWGRLAGRLAGPMLRWRWFEGMVAAGRDRKDRHVGRLYTFVAEKPAR
jgi:SAM-dependent methyltransferase